MCACFSWCHSAKSSYFSKKFHLFCYLYWGWRVWFMCIASNCLFSRLFNVHTLTHIAHRLATFTASIAFKHWLFISHTFTVSISRSLSHALLLRFVFELSVRKNTILWQINLSIQQKLSSHILWAWVSDVHVCGALATMPWTRSANFEESCAAAIGFYMFIVHGFTVGSSKHFVNNSIRQFKVVLDLRNCWTNANK